ncbi:hypothetical protein WJX72_001524 [[Myrmecia] bisecta]|uniref:Uncharacterized protein n=1 Tax=[Myrmecia] bisecta TaxID=41462 RepID=A0AAW1PW99_9CHLO
MVSLAVLLSPAVVESRRLHAPAVIDGYSTEDGRFPYNARVEARTPGSSPGTVNVGTCTGSLIAPTLDGDSGGPLLVQGATPADDVQWGSDSYGKHVNGYCGETNAASVYMDLTYPPIRSFIDDTIKGEPCQGNSPDAGG